jgi:anti-sigma B factor antagonist
LSIRTSTRLVEGIVIVDIIGQLKLGPATGALRNVVRGLVSDGYKSIVLNFADVITIDSCGIGELVSTLTSVRNDGGDLKLLNLSKNVKNVMHITRLFTIFQTYENQAAAVESFHQTGLGAKV